jgi:fluoride ion exporter CrcB/FEX
MKVATRIALIYTLVSALATVVNIATQALVVAFYDGAFAIQLSVLLGTAAGFPIKYLLEKKHVFEFHADNLAHDTRLFILYGFMGVFTTLIFWGVEWAFQVLFQTDSMRYLGGAIGLAVGSFIKYHLDKRYVFKQVAA